MEHDVLLILAGVLAVLFLFRRALGGWFKSALAGAAGLGLCRLASLLPLNLFTCLSSTVLGLPGLVGLLFLNLFWK